MKDCPQCHRTGVVPLTVTTHGEDKVKRHILDCPTCDGTGVVTEEMFQYLKAESEIYCKCEDSDLSQWEYHPDGNQQVYNKIVRIRKHHYTCGECGKVTQIG